MNKILFPSVFRTIGLCALVFALLITCCACGNTLSGTYRSDGLISQTFTFSGDQATMSAFGLNITGTYKIEKDEIAITYSLLGTEQTWRQSFSRSGSDIIIGGTKFIKQ